MLNNMKEFRVSNDAMDDPIELRRRMDEEGYIFIKKLHDPDRLLSLRREMMQVCVDGGWLVQGTDVMSGIADVSAQCTEGDRKYTDVYHEIYKLESFHRSGHWPETLGIIEKIVDGPALAHPKKIARLWFPQYTEHTTPIHQDFVHFQGIFDTYTCWSPVGDCPIELGALAVLPGSHKINAVHDHHFSLGAGSLAIDEADLADNWVTTNYEIGDALFFHSLTVHQALPNLTEDRLRISLDNRYQASGFPIAEHMLEPHLKPLHMITWDEIYENWGTTDLQYYWKETEMEILPHSKKWGEQGFEDALKRALQGDVHAVHHLQRIVDVDPDSEAGQRSARALEVAANKS